MPKSQPPLFNNYRKRKRTQPVTEDFLGPGTFVGKGTFNIVTKHLGQDGKYYIKKTLRNKSNLKGTPQDPDAPERLKRITKILYPNLVTFISHDGSYCCEFVEGTQATQKDIQRELIRIYKLSGRIVYDGYSPGNFLQRPDDKKIIGVDLGQATKMAPDGSGYLSPASKKQKTWLLDRKYYRRDEIKTYKDFPITYTTMALKFIAEFMPGYQDVEFLYNNDPLLMELAEAQHYQELFKKKHDPGYRKGTAVWKIEHIKKMRARLVLFALSQLSSDLNQLYEYIDENKPCNAMKIKRRYQYLLKFYEKFVLQLDEYYSLQMEMLNKLLINMSKGFDFCESAQKGHSTLLESFSRNSKELHQFVLINGKSCELFTVPMPPSEKTTMRIFSSLHVAEASIQEQKDDKQDIDELPVTPTSSKRKKFEF